MPEGMSVGELFVKLGFQADDAKLRDFLGELGDVNIKSLAAGVGLVGIYEAAKRVMDVAGENALVMRRFSAETGQSAQKMQQWTVFAEEMGLSAGDVVGSVKSLEDQVARLKITGEGTQFWHALGIDPTSTRDTFQLLEQLRGSIRKLQPDAQRWFMQQLGLSDSMLVLFNATDDAWEAMRKLITNTDEQTASVAANVAAWRQFQGELRAVFTDLAAIVSPVLEVLAGILDWFARVVHESPALQSAIVGITAAIGALGTALAVVSLASWASGIAPAILAFSVLFGLIVGVVTWLWKMKDAIAGIPQAAGRLVGPALAMPFRFLSPEAIGAGAAGISGATSNVTRNNTFHIGPIHGGDSDDLAKKIQQAISDAVEDTGSLSYPDSH